MQCDLIRAIGNTHNNPKQHNLSCVSVFLGITNSTSISEGSQIFSDISFIFLCERLQLPQVNSALDNINKMLKGSGSAIELQDKDPGNEYQPQLEDVYIELKTIKEGSLFKWALSVCYAGCTERDRNIPSSTAI